MTNPVLFYYVYLYQVDLQSWFESWWEREEEKEKEKWSTCCILEMEGFDFDKFTKHTAVS